MLHTLLNPIKLPPYKSLAKYEGKGNWAIAKYYRFPYSIIYQRKLKLISDLMGDRHYRNILDFGSGPGIFKPELKKRSQTVVCVDKRKPLNLFWKFNAIVCASVLEFCDLPSTMATLCKVFAKDGELFVASPMDTWFTRLYFKLIGDKHVRNSHHDIVKAVASRFRIEIYAEWLGIYFVLKAVSK